MKLVTNMNKDVNALGSMIEKKYKVHLWDIEGDSGRRNKIHWIPVSLTGEPVCGLCHLQGKSRWISQVLCEGVQLA